MYVKQGSRLSPERVLALGNILLHNTLSTTASLGRPLGKRVLGASKLAKFLGTNAAPPCDTAAFEENSISTVTAVVIYDE